MAECGRCDKRAQTAERFSYQGDTYELDLCNGCAELLSRDLFMWARCGILMVDEATRISEFAKSYTPRSRPPSGAGTGSVATSSEQSEQVAVEAPLRLVDLPLWRWTRHAEERLAERGPIYGFTREDVLSAVQFGSNWFPPDLANGGDGLERRRRGPVIAVLDFKTKTIVTVFSPDDEDQDQDINGIVRDHG